MYSKTTGIEKEGKSTNSQSTNPNSNSHYRERSGKKTGGFDGGLGEGVCIREAFFLEKQLPATAGVKLGRKEKNGQGGRGLLGLLKSSLLEEKSVGKCRLWGNKFTCCHGGREPDLGSKNYRDVYLQTTGGLEPRYETLRKKATSSQGKETGF